MTDPLLPHAEVLLASASYVNLPPIVSMKLRYWRAIHAEFMTHRVFSRNASSSRAVPVHKMAEIANDIYVPIFRANQPGMMPGEFLGHPEQVEAERLWREAAAKCVETAMILGAKDGLNVHKQWANRMMEWFGFINVQATATDWDNFFRLRLETNEDGSPVPQDEMYYLALAMKNAYDSVNLEYLMPGQWHLPWITKDERAEFDLADLKKISAARSASISYETVDGKPMTVTKAITLCDKLLVQAHMSPFEHQAMADERIEGSWAHRALHGNFTGFAQWRKFIEEEFK